jgi:hypothetical protein
MPCHNIKKKKQLLKQHDSRAHNMLDVLSSNADGGVGDKDKEGCQKEGCEKDKEGGAHLQQTTVEKYRCLLVQKYFLY